MADTILQSDNVIAFREFRQLASAGQPHAVLASYTRAIQSIKALSDELLASGLPNEAKLAHLAMLATCVKALWDSNAEFVQMGLNHPWEETAGG